MRRLFALRFVLVSSFSASLSVLPAPAFAEGGAAPSAQVEKLRASVEKDIAKVRRAIELKLKRHSVSKERRAAIHQVVDAEVAVVTEALESAVDDGQLSVRESEQVRFLTRHLRGRIKQRLQEEKEQRVKEAPPPPRLGPEKPAREGDSEHKPEGTPKPAELKPSGPPPSSQPEPGDLRPQPYPLPAPSASPSP
jgi:hypothetical protein